MLPYIYQPLNGDADTECGSIRLLVLHPASQRDILCGQLIQSNCSRQYEALSYCWEGKVAQPCDSYICIIDGVERYRLDIKPNLEAALRRLRLLDGPRILWVDAICINQNDNAEKSQQVPMMKEIYEGSENVCVWLGEATTDDDAAISLIRRVNDFSFLEGSSDSQWLDELTSFASFAKKDWFGRRWIIQEISFACKATVYCGDNELPWEDLTSGISITCYTSINEAAEQRLRHRQQLEDTAKIHFSNANKLVFILENMFYGSDRSNGFVNKMSLEALVSEFAFFGTSKPHDAIFALLSLAKGKISPSKAHDNSLLSVDEDPARNALQGGCQSKPLSKPFKALQLNVLLETPRDTEEVEVIVNYDQSFADVCQNFVSFAIRSSDSLDIVCRPWAPVIPHEVGSGTCHQELPSWVCLLSKAPMQSSSSSAHVRLNADLLIGNPDSRTAIYSASTNTVPILHPFIGSSQSLFATGFVFSYVKNAGEPAVEAVVPESWLELGGWLDPDRRPPPDDLWRTMLADRYNDGQRPSTACQRIFKDVLTISPAADLDKFSTETRSDLVKLVQRVTAVIWNRRLIRTEPSHTWINSDHQEISEKSSTAIEPAKLGFLGLVPQEAQAGDMICLLRGCSVPVIVRKLVENQGGPQCLSTDVSSLITESQAQKLGIKQRIRCKLIGASYIHGIMDGEAFEMHDARNDAECLFEIV